MNGTRVLPDLGKRVYVERVVRAGISGAAIPIYDVEDGIVRNPRNERGWTEVRLTATTGAPVVVECDPAILWDAPEDAAAAVDRYAIADERVRQIDIHAMGQRDPMACLPLLLEISQIQGARAAFAAVMKARYGVEVTARPQSPAVRR